VEGLKGEPHALYEVAPQRHDDGSIASVTFVGYDQVIPGEAEGWEYKSGTPTNQAGPSIDYWHTTVTNDFGTNLPWQLFVNEEMQIPARYPDAKYDDDSIFSASSWLKTTKDSIYRNDINQDSTVVEASGDLASSGLNVTGASAILNILHWFTFTTVVTDHTPGDSTVVYRKQPGWKGSKWKAGSDIFFLENKAEFISQENEWFYDKDTRELMVALKGGKDAKPSELNIGLRVQEYAFRITSTTDFRLRDLKFVGTTVYAASTSKHTTIHGIIYDSLQFFYPSAMKRAVVGDHRHSWPTTLYEKKDDQPCRNKMFNCTLMGNEGDPTAHLRGSGLEINNNLFRKIDYTAVTTVPCKPLSNDPGICADGSYGGGGKALGIAHGTVSLPALIKRNTIDTYGGSSGVNVGKNVDVTLNRISGAKDIQLDGALIQAGGHDRYEYGESSTIWEPPLCDSFGTAGACQAAGCTWSSNECSGNPSESYLALPENQPPTEATDGSSWYGTHYSHNWVYDSTNPRASKRALRFDRAQDICNGRFGNTWANHGTLTNNVAWNTQGIMVKGSGIETEHNTVFGTDMLTPDSEGSSIRDLTVYDEFDEGTCYCNSDFCKLQPTTCCVTLADGTEVDTTFEGRNNVQMHNLLGRKYRETEGSFDHLLPGTSEGNVAGPNALMQLRDISNQDFRPKSRTFLSGAYSAEDDVYWIPGRQEWIPSSPVPPNNADRVQLDADLMFLPRLARDDDESSDDTHVVYAACSLEQLDTDSAYSYTLENGQNIAPMPAELARPGKTVYWRVDTQSAAGDVIRGNVWEFTYIDAYSDENAPPAPPGRCQTYFGPQVNLADKEILSVATVSEITVDAKAYDTDQYTLVESKVCVDLKDATFGIQDLQLRLSTKGGFSMLKSANQGDGNELKVCFTDTASSTLPKTSDGGSPFEGDWKPKSFSIADRVDQFPGSSGWAKLMMKDHGSGRDYTGLFEWSLELCYDGWEEPYNDWLDSEEERIQKKEEEENTPWCPDTSAPIESPPTAAPVPCMDDPNYNRDGKPKLTCANIFKGYGADGWMGKWTTKCNRVDTITGLPVHNYCQESCSKVDLGSCATTTPSPPIAAPTQAPTHVCKRNERPNQKFNLKSNGKEFDCTKVGTRTLENQRKLCNRKIITSTGKIRRLHKKCPITCGNVGVGECNSLKSTKTAKRERMLKSTKTQEQHQ
jgi:hypothetical protein